jgi:hypothetical protein
MTPRLSNPLFADPATPPKPRLLSLFLRYAGKNNTFSRFPSFLASFGCGNDLRNY